MSIPKIAEIGWLEFTIDHLRESLKAAEELAADLAKMKTCDGAGCGRMFDGTDPRCVVVKEGETQYHFCPGCEADALAATLRYDSEKRQL